MRGFAAGIVAAAVWAAAEPAAQRIFRTRYSDARLLGALLTPGPAWYPLGVLVHLINGAVFGAAFARVGGHGWRQALIAAEVENLVLWPGMAIVDRIHPDRRSGAWPPLRRSTRVFAYEATMHGLFGVVLGLLVKGSRRARARGDTDDSGCRSAPTE
jgi:hypothetical protein